MQANESSRIHEVLERHHAALHSGWVDEQVAIGLRRDDLMPLPELQKHAADLLAAMREASRGGNLEDLERQEWRPVRAVLAEVSRARALRGFSPTETATFVYSLKRPMFEQLRALSQNGDDLARDVWTATQLLDKLGLFTIEAYLRAREEVISRQHQDLLELSTPVVKLWEGILALPLIGTLDSSRTQVVMESLLQRIVETGSEVAILDITGVPTVDTLVAQHLIKAVTAARLMGADCIISGIRPQIAQTIVHLGVDLGGITTKASLADAFSLALRRSGYTVGRITELRNQPSQ